MYNHSEQEIHAAIGVSEERAAELQGLMNEYYDSVESSNMSEFMEIAENVTLDQREAMLMCIWFAKKTANEKAEFLVQAIVAGMLNSLMKNSNAETTAKVLADVTQVVSSAIDIASGKGGDE